MKKLPKTIIRLDDGEEFVLNKNGTYSLKASLEWKKKGHLINEYTYECLMSLDGFKVADGTEDIEGMKKAYWEMINNRGDWGEEHYE